MVGSFPASVAAAPLNGDASTDLAVANVFTEKVNILFNDFTPVVKPPTENPPAQSAPAQSLPIQVVPPKKKCPKGKQLKKGKCVKKKCPKGKKLKRGRCVKSKPKGRRD